MPRHGARLDAVDPEWHLHSPTPYDAPLSYGGWIQTKTLGARIASILTSNDINLSPDARKPKKIVIHSSPFLRCVQTAIGISAGIGQSVIKFHSVDGQSPTDIALPISKLDQDGGRSRGRERGKETSKLSMQTLTEEDESPWLNLLSKPILRIDACLGEWLSPDYFEHITPPPNSQLMVLSAKAELLAEEEINTFEAHSAVIGNFPGGWQRNANVEMDTSEDELPEIDMTSGRSSLAQALSRVRASSQSRVPFRSELSNATSDSTSSAILAYGGYYHPAVPTYAIAPTDSIPRGYVAHARSHCLDVDLHWDSMKDPQEWGDGGELGEEWSSMHRRFRKGITSVVNWYKNHQPLIESEGNMGPQMDEPDSDCELIVILVTHSAGCNALIGALTNQPVLVDVGQASLTIALQREEAATNSALSNSPTGHRRDPVDMGLATEYEVKLRASVDHLRTDAGPASLTAIMLTPSPILRPSKPSENFAFRSIGSRNVWSTSRALSMASSSSKNTSPGPTRSSTRQSSGLWQKPQSESSEKSTSASTTSRGGGLFTVPPDLQRTPSNPSNPSKLSSADDEAMHNNATLWTTPKRRWTTTEGSM